MELNDYQRPLSSVERISSNHFCHPKSAISPYKRMPLAQQSMLRQGKWRDVGKGPESEYSFRLGTVEALSSSGSGGVASEMALQLGL